MLGDPRKAQEVFHATLREAAVRAARGELPSEPFWLFRDARWRCLEATKSDLQPESVEMDERDVAPKAEFDYQEILDIAELKLSELSRFLAKGRRQLQAWLDSKFPQPSKV